MVVPTFSIKDSIRLDYEQTLKSTGLIRYSSENEMNGKSRKLLTLR